MDLDLSEEQEVLRDMVRGLCRDYAPLDVVRQMEDDARGYPEEFWKQLGELGLLGILIPEDQGGSGQTLLEAALVYEEFGRSLAPSPHFPSAVLCAGALLASGDADARREWLPRIASGQAIWTPAWVEPGGRYSARGVQAEAREQGDAFAISGVKRHVPFAAAAQRLLVLARTGAGETGIDLFAVDPAQPGVRLTQQRSLASDTQYQVELDAARGTRIGAGEAGRGWATWDAVMHDGAILLAAQAVGGAERALEITVQYAKDRKQFDKPLGAFQAISHYLADAATQIDGARTLVHEAAWARSEGRSVERLAPMAKLFACQTYRDVTAMAQQVWGGVGFTVEYDIQLFFRRAKQLQISWWDERDMEERIARCVLDGPAEGS